MKKQNPKRGKSRAIANFFMLTAITAGLSAYLTVKSEWNAGTVAVIAILLCVSAFYFWLWRNYFK